MHSLSCNQFRHWVTVGRDHRVVAKSSFEWLGFLLAGSLEYNFRLRLLHVLARTNACFDGEFRSRDLNILDAGCGFGRSTLFFAKIFPKSHILGLELDAHCILSAQKVRSTLSAAAQNRLEFVKGDLTNYHAKKHYDVIYCLEVLEHIQKDEAVLKAFSAALRPAGRLLITVPLETFPPSKGHLPGRYSHFDMVQKLERNGLVVEDFSYFCSPYAGGAAWYVDHFLKKMFEPLSGTLRLLCHPLLCLVSILDVLIQPKFGLHLLFVAKKKI